jgi:isoquinoline 1-oxidoreductase beta subunit
VCAGHPTRRALLASGGGFVVSLALGRLVDAAPFTAGTIAGDAPNVGPFIHIPRTGPITFVAPSTEMGQGIYTAECQMFAEELHVELGDIRIVAAPVDAAYINPVFHSQSTGGSTSTMAFYTPLREAAASARERLIAAAAARWNADPATCRAENGAVLHVPSGRRLPYGAVADAAALEPPPRPGTLRLTQPEHFRVIGKSAQRLDTPAKANGTAVFGIDVLRPGMKIAIMASCPTIGGHLVSVDPRPAMAVPGVRRVLSLPAAVVVLADHTWAGIKGARMLTPQWAGGDTSISTDSMEEQLREADETGTPVTTQKTGDVTGALGNDSGRIDAIYELPFLYHATMEPLNAVVELSADRCEVWVGTQSPERAKAAVCRLTGLAPDKVVIHNLLMGGGFGRRQETDIVNYAVEIAKLAHVPVKLIWTREQDLRAGKFRPAFRNRIQARLGSDNKIKGWSHRIVGGDVYAAYDAAMKGPDVDALEGAETLPYDVGPMLVEYVRKDPPIPITWFRSVGPGHNLFVVEGMIEELAENAGVDAVTFRRSILKEDPRALRVLNLVVGEANWGAPLPGRVGRGLALQVDFGSYLACVIEAAVTPDGGVTLRRVTAAVDCGQPINPDGIITQIQGGLVFGLSCALWGRVDVAGGQIVQSNFNDYRVLRMDEVPRIDVHVVPNTEPPGGIGEAGTSVGVPALAAAIHAATGVRLRSAPFDRHDQLRQDRPVKATE